MASTGRPRNDERRRERQQAFLAAFSKTGLVKNASEESGVAAAQHYRWLDEDEDYAAMFNVQKMRTAHLAQQVRRSPGPARGFKHTGSRAERRKANQDRFLEALAESGIVQDASEQAGVPMGTHYFWLRDDKAYAERAEMALKAAAETRKQLISERIGAGSRRKWDEPGRREAWGEYQQATWTPEKRSDAAERMRKRMAPDSPEKAGWLADQRRRREFTACGNPSYFDQIDTPDKAYWLGFIVTDGMVTGFSSGSLRMRIKLARKDRAHLELLHRTLQAKRPIRDTEEWSKPPGAERKKRPVSILDVCSPQIVNALVGHGVKPRKTDIVEPWDGPCDLMPHYWRGIMDGDGTLGTYDGEVKVGLCGSRPLVEAFIEWAHGVSGTTANARQGTQGNRRYCTVYMGGNIRAPKLLAALYDDAPVALARKKAEADLIVHGKPFNPTLF